ncbi:uncharacterized protein LOC124362225 [Homalodisca vitripennis]|uniref:uncharacterized protein LOC124362225 n=1 Tax=Homalodisca vitripennis TaxID=197043 RepID=UPI001EEB481B|nr:uncharacterized protein LOC124362225 [Homalodisca vitripennis]
MNAETFVYSPDVGSLSSGEQGIPEETMPSWYCFGAPSSVSSRSAYMRGPPESPAHASRPTSPAQIMVSASYPSKSQILHFSPDTTRSFTSCKMSGSLPTGSL